MDAFAPTPPKWTNQAVHAYKFCCPTCHANSREAEKVWVNRRSPVMAENYRRKWQEFYQCHCGCVWWAWSDDRPSSELSANEQNPI